MSATQTFDIPVRGPRDVPTLRLMLLDGWRLGGPYDVSADLAVEAGPDGRMRRTLSPAFDSTALANASLWWATADMTALVQHAAASLPPTSLTEDLLPADWGLAVFARPLVGSAADTGDPIWVHALLWGLTMKADEQFGPLPAAIRGFDPAAPGAAVSISCYGRLGTDPATGKRSTATPDAERGPWVPLGRTGWLWGQDTACVTSESWDETHRASMEEERRWLAALWLLAAQERVAQSQEVTPLRQQRRRDARDYPDARTLAASAVRLVDVRRPKHQPGDATRSAPQWASRWIVRGHWRQQAYGPGRALHRPLFIDEFVKGPPSKPLRLKETVNVLRPSPEEVERDG